VETGTGEQLNFNCFNRFLREGRNDEPCQSIGRTNRILLDCKIIPDYCYSTDIKGSEDIRKHISKWRQ
jgi:hypothetical protein